MKLHAVISVATLSVSMLLCAVMGTGQVPSPPQRGTAPNAPYPGSSPDPFGRSHPEDHDPFAGKMAEQQARNRNTDRQKHLVDDTEKLFNLANELKQQVGKTDKNTLSVDVIKKADEIEKLAHSVKERMKG